jgi:hypothetical protein
MLAVVDGAELPIRDDKDPEWGTVVARYLDPTYVAVLWIYQDDSEDSGWYHEIVMYRRLADGELEHFTTGGSDWFGAPGGAAARTCLAQRAQVRGSRRADVPNRSRS